jgi:hypothetical protein
MVVIPKRRSRRGTFFPPASTANLDNSPPHREGRDFKSCREQPFQSSLGSRHRPTLQELGTRVDYGGEQSYTPPIVDRQNATPGQVLLGHLAITVPVVLAVPLVVYWGLGEFGPLLWPYYVTGGIGLGWQWYTMTLPRWEHVLIRSGLQANRIEDVARRSGLVWPGAGAIGSFALHTTAVPICGIVIGPWLFARWFVWILPLFRISPAMPRADYWLQNLELVSIIPALVFCALMARYLEKLASWAWIVPTIILSYRLLTFTDANASVLASADSWSRFSYYFVIQQHMPTFSLSFGLSGDPIRAAQQLDVTVPFYSGIAYSVGALFTKHKTIDRIVSGLRRKPEPAPGHRRKSATPQ